MKRLFSSHWSLKLFGFGSYAERCTQSGFMPRRVAVLQYLGSWLSQLWMFIQVGRVRVVGRENLRAEGRLIFCGNHSAMFDAPIIYPLLPKNTRYMTAREQMLGFGGWKAVMMGSMGCFPVDRANGRTAVAPAVEALVGGEQLAIFPEGKISESGEYLKFKTGSARIAIEPCDRRNHYTKVAIVPINICYGKRDEATAGGPFVAMGFKWRHGVTVTVGKPIYIHNVEPLTAKNVTQVVRDAIIREACETSYEHR